MVSHFHLHTLKPWVFQVDSVPDEKVLVDVDVLETLVGHRFASAPVGQVEELQSFCFFRIVGVERVSVQKFDYKLPLVRFADLKIQARNITPEFVAQLAYGITHFHC